MGNLLFTYGTMGSGKTEALLANYDINKICTTDREMYSGTYGKEIYLMSTNSNKISSRNGKEMKCKRINDFLDLFKAETKSIIFIDEVQFLTRDQVNTIRGCCDIKDLFIYCYGLLTDYKQELFEGSKRLLEVADETNEIVHSCEICGKNAARFNIRTNNNNKLIDLNKGNYKAVCWKCLNKYKK